MFEVGPDPEWLASRDPASVEIARRLASILPRLTIEEALETSRIYSRVGKLTSDTPLIVERPFRAPRAQRVDGSIHIS